MRCRGLLSSVVASSMVLTACGTDDGESIFSDLGSIRESDGPETAFGRALTLVDATETSYIGFADQSRITALGTAEWALLSSIGAPLAEYPVEGLGIDMDSAELLITLGDSSLIHGGQNSRDVTEAAEAAGWEDVDGVLHQEPVSTQPLSVPAPSLLPFNESVAYGESVEGFQPSENTLYDAKSALSHCLGDVISAVVMDDVAVGVSEEGGVICSVPSEERPADLAERISDNLNGPSWANYVEDVEPTTSDVAVKVTFTHTRSADPTMMMNALRSGEYRDGFAG